MTNPDSATPRAAIPPQTVQVVHAPSRFTGLSAVALTLALVAVCGTALVFFLLLKQLAVPQQSDVLRERLKSDEARLALLENDRAGDVATLKALLEPVRSELAALATRVGRLEAAPDSQSPARLDDLDRRLAAVRADFDFRLATLERNALSSDLPQRVAALSGAQAGLGARLVKLERLDPSVTMRRAAAELALANLVRASGGGGAFAVELQTFRVLMPDAPEAAELAPIARKGAPARSDLVAGFAAVATAALMAESRARANGWLGRLWSNIANVIVVRRIGDSKGADSESILARAGEKLHQGDLAGAVAEVKSLKGNARIAAQPWLSDAQARLAIEQSTAALANRMSKLLATP